MNVLLNIDETTPEFSVKVTSPFSVEIDFSPKRVAAQPTVDVSAALVSYSFKSGDIASVERAFARVDAAAKRGTK